MTDAGGSVLATMRSAAYLRLLLLAALVGAPISAAAYWFLRLTSLLQGWTYTDLPRAVGFHTEPTWWPVLPLLVAGVGVGLVIRYLPGAGGHSPADGFKTGGVPAPNILVGVALAALLSIGLGAVVGPEGPLIALGGGLAYLAVARPNRVVPPRAAAVIAATGSFAAISTLLGTPLAGAFLLMEASGLGGATATVALLPGLLASGIGTLIFIGFDSITGYGTFSLALPNLPAMPAPTGVELLYALAAGVVAAPLCLGIHAAAVRLRSLVSRHTVPFTAIVGLAIAGCAIAYALATGHASSDVLFSGQSAMPKLVSDHAGYTVGALLLLMACKGLAYTGSLSAFRGGPTFPAMFLGVAGGIAMSHLPGLDLVAGIAIGLAAMTAGILRLPLTAVLLATLLLGTDGYHAIPLSVIAAVVSYVLVERRATASESPPALPQQRAGGGSTGDAAKAPLPVTTPQREVEHHGEGRPRQVRHQ